MKSPTCKFLNLLLLTLAVAGLATFSTGLASAQTDVYRVNYFTLDNEAAIFQTVRIDNPGTTYGNVCAMIYVYAADQQLAECCGCMETPNGLRTIPFSSLLFNTLTGVFPPSGVFKIVSAAPNGSVCDPTNVRPTPALREWGTHTQSTTTSPFFVLTETTFTPVTLGATELANLQAQCSFIHILGSGHGLCTCGTGD